MMSVRIESAGKALSVEQVEVLEQELGEQLPAEYQRFLQKYNGGRPSPDVVDIDGMPGSPTDIQVFFGIGCEVESSELDWNRRIFSGRIPHEMLPIACDSGGSLFCLSLSGPDRGSVSYYDFQRSVPGRYRVADDFDAFLAKIREF